MVIQELNCKCLTSKKLKTGFSYKLKLLSKYVPNPHLPIIACNKDLTFKGAASLPRFGHGAFLECLESLYMVKSLAG